MHLFAFILIGGIWAVFLLPSALDGRRRAPMTSTRHFARAQDLLASVATHQGRHIVQRRRSSVRRRRVLSSLGGGALLSLLIAIATGSGMWLGVTITFDIAFAGFVTLLLMTQQAAPMQAQVVPLRLAEPPADNEPVLATVRVVAG